MEIKTATKAQFAQYLRHVCQRVVMSIEEFDKMDERQKLDLLQTKAVYIGKREMDRWMAILFQLDSFYVEIIYRRYRRTVHEIRTSESTDFIALYLDQVKLDL